MRRKLGWLVAVLVAAGLLVPASPPASATTVETEAVVLTMNITGGGLGYPCTPVGTTTNCVPGVTTTTGSSSTGVPFVRFTQTSGNTRGFTLTSSVCVAAVANVQKGAKAPAQGGTCTLTASGVLTGYCGLATGRGTGTMTRGEQTDTWDFDIEIGWPYGVRFRLRITKTNNQKTGEGQGELEHHYFLDQQHFGPCTTKSETTATLVGAFESVLL